MQKSMVFPYKRWQNRGRGYHRYVQGCPVRSSADVRSWWRVGRNTEGCIFPYRTADETRCQRNGKRHQGLSTTSRIPWSEPVDVENLEKMLLKVSEFVDKTPEVKELDLNPIFAYKTERLLLMPESFWRIRLTKKLIIFAIITINTKEGS